MAYSKQTWVRGEKVSSAKLNHMEDGIEAISANGAIDTANLAPAAVTNEKLDQEAVDSDNIRTGAIITPLIYDGAVTLPKLSGDVNAHLAIEYENITWEHGGINLNTGETTADGSLSRSRVIEYLDTRDIINIINDSNSVLWLCFYARSNGAYTFENAVNVDAGTTWSASNNHARYVRFDFRSSTEDAENIYVLTQDVKNSLDYIQNTKYEKRLYDVDGITPVSLNDFFKGNIALNGTSVTYANYAKRIATRKGVTYSLTKGDSIYLSDYTDARFYVYWRVGNNWYSSGAWITGGIYTVPVTGDYAVLLSNKTEKDQSDVSDLASLLIIKKNNLVSYVAGIVEMVKAGQKPKNNTANAYLSEAKPLTLLHFSDVHGDAVETDRINDVYQDVVNLCNDVICTGDMCESRFSDDASFITDKGFLLCIGNHDALADPTGWDWSQIATQQQLYDKFFAPTIANWGVTYTPNTTYYYKDYEENGIRLVVLNNFLSADDMETQKTWLTSTLNDAITNDLSVIIAMHYHPNNAQKIDSNFTRLDKEPMQQSSGGAIPYRVQQFIQSGGKFICYLVGHEHSDYVMNSSDYPNQIAICIDAASLSQSNIYSELARRYGDKSQDLYNVCIFDTSTKTIKLIRVGCDDDNYIRSRKSLSIKYDTRQIIAEQ